jgi:hypothetical protein
MPSWLELTTFSICSSSVAQSWGGGDVQVAAARGSERMLDVLLAKLEANDPVILGLAFGEAARGGHVGMCDMLAARGVWPDVDDFVVAAGSGSVGVCEFLIRLGIPVNATAADGQSPLHGAAKAGNADIIRLLIANGADVNMESDRRGWTPLYEAIDRFAPAEVCALLIDAGADITSACELPGDLTPFQYAVTRGRERIVRHFVDVYHEDLDQRAVDGKELGELAAEEPEMLELLLALKAERAVAIGMGAPRISPLGERRSPSLSPV